MRGLRLKPSRGLYLHIPFCSIKCFYCDFTAFSGQKKIVSRYLKALDQEASFFPNFNPDTLYIGGGTPSELSAEELRVLFKMIRSRFPKADFKEATFEANPESLNIEKIKILKDSGVNRISLGLQTLDDRLLKSIGRRHSSSDFLSVFSSLRETGNFSISVDLMFGLPEQKLEDHLRSLKQVLDLFPEHLSLYGLQVEDWTLFSKRKISVDESLAREMFEGSIEILKTAGFVHYEVSNFALSGFESLHNRIYWRNGEYLGLGCGSASYLNGMRTMNEDRLVSYCAQIESGKRAIASSEKLEGIERLGEMAFLGLRMLEGYVPPPESRQVFAPQWDSLISRGLIERRGEAFRLTQEGVFLANQVFMEFVSPFNQISNSEALG